jgi:molecular chaperone GrpE
MSETADQTSAQTPNGASSEGQDATGNATPAGVSAEARELERQLEEVRQKLKEAETRAQENLDRWQRAQADLSNYRRRAQFDREELEKFAVANLVAALLPVLDSFDRAWLSLPGQFRRLTWLAGVAMIHSQLRGTLERVGVAEIQAEDQPFDPSVHEAVDREEGDGPPHILAVLQAGYKIHERVIRPALVKVGPKPATPEPTPQAEPTSSQS